jgi:hypothetical protein
MKLIELRGRYAVGVNRFAAVDDDRFEELTRSLWKAKPNGSKSGVYAVRNAKVGDRYVTLRMHRIVLGYNGDLDVHHIDHDTLNNCRANLRVVSRAENVRECQIEISNGVCPHCDQHFERTIKKGSRGRIIYCSKRCAGAAQRRRHPRRRHRARRPPVMHEHVCASCNNAYSTKFVRQLYCSVKCRMHVKWKRMVAANHPAIERARLRCRAWHQARKDAKVLLDHTAEAGSSTRAVSAATPIFESLNTSLNTGHNTGRGDERDVD